MLLSLLILFAVLIEYLVTYNFAKRLSTCECAKSWKRNAIVNMTLFNIIHVVFTTFGSGMPPLSYSLLFLIFSMIYFWIVLSYTHELKEKNCECAGGLDANFLYFTRVFDIIIIATVITFTLFMPSTLGIRKARR
jgi:hypothetical protein